MFYGDNDPITLKSNVLQLYKQLPNVILLEEIPYRLFTHMDFLWSIDGKALLYDRVIEVMQEFESGSNTSFR
ncbi:Lipase 3 [Camponotus floridanus]|uniref:Lipase 3 n=2 Tax=Camponotus floridanus TaxID=104421 RepID=E2A900_CAMFO|nr:Lipase 3 [Camponotus floridanus]